ncbi:MAG: 50S ribosomal protein L32 [Patescibacteria group bacterium]|nr:50S ribosomal protein L32 [Patescibacteria group bacterium]MDD5121152.1 50S ribosomal protein L32 [Patescibacteria group bacterium]MDD5221667.1 50S ribosomal protein L32 [Patescibacteria group bacterium]MDD5395929.1 50S ribosomal protein L32 [Patescibacteria group bacterium]
MALPNQKRAKSRKRVKQYRLRIKKMRLNKCPKCGKAVQSHHACSFCGYYANRQVITLRDKKHKAHQHEHEHNDKHKKEEKEKHEHKHK